MKRALLLLLIPAAAAAGPFEHKVAPHAGSPLDVPVALTAYGSVLSEPFPSAAGVNLGLTFFDTLRVAVGFGLPKFFVMNVTGMRIATWGASARLHWPGLRVTPFVGGSIARTHIRRSPFGKFGDWRQDVTYYHPHAGLEWRLDSGAFFNGGVLIPFEAKRDQGDRPFWRGWFPFFQAGVTFGP
jgi:hypothetical protein